MMTPQLLKEILLPVVESLAERFQLVEARVAALEAAKPSILLGLPVGSPSVAPLNWPTLDPIAPTPSDRQGFEPREYTERS